MTVVTAHANAVTYFVDRHPEEGRGDKIAFREIGSGRALNYGDMVPWHALISAPKNAPRCWCWIRSNFRKSFGAR